jgi:F0F1-type ATP synthase beta subunit
MKTKEQLQEELSDKQKAAEKLTNESKELKKKIDAIDNANKPKTIMERVNDYNDILTILGTDESKDVIVLDKFTEEDMNVVKAFIQKVRISKVYNEGKRFTKDDRRYYNWYDVSSGFGFGDAVFDRANATTLSASRLCFNSSEKSRDAAKKFWYIDEAFIDLK